MTTLNETLKSLLKGYVSGSLDSETLVSELLNVAYSFNNAELKNILHKRAFGNLSFDATLFAVNEIAFS